MAGGSVKGIVPAGALNQLVTAHLLLRLGERISSMYFTTPS
jgi:hypothetical protein